MMIEARRGEGETGHRLCPESKLICGEFFRPEVAVAAQSDDRSDTLLHVLVERRRRAHGVRGRSPQQGRLRRLERNPDVGEQAKANVGIALGFQPGGQAQGLG